MEYFNTYVSNTTAGGGNQKLFPSDGLPHTGRIFYRITTGGRYNYSLLFSNIIDSTFSDGAISRKNRILDSWEIHEVKIGRCTDLDFAAVHATKNQETPAMATMSSSPSNAENHIVVSDFRNITFAGKAEKRVMPGEFFSSDPVEMEFAKGDYLCFEITFSGKELPYHDESVIPAFVQEGDKWIYDKHIPFPGMIGIDRKVKNRIAFLGDSITQGCGTAVNSYTHWNAVLSALLPEENAYWNLGLGYGRADDAASDGAWLFKAKQNDYVIVCFGVNDINRGFTAEQIKENLNSIVTLLQNAGAKVMLQTVPPFNYNEERTKTWNNINEFIRTEMALIADAIFDNVPLLSTDGPHCPTAKYGGHPNAEGCYRWAKELEPRVREFINK